MTPVPFIGYAPDENPTVPGLITNCSAIVPSTRGFIGAPTPVDAGLDALPSKCYGAAVVKKLDDSFRIFAGTASTMAELSGASFVPMTGATLTGLGGTDSWSFAQFGDTTLFAAKTEIVKFLNTATVMASCTATAPKGAYVETVNNFVMLFNVQDQGAIYDSADRPHGWWCAGKGGYTSWTPSITTEAATGDLSSTPGKLTGARRFGYQVVAYKLQSMYLGTYVGQPQIWDFQLIPGDAGALSNNAIVSVGTPENPKHIFMGWDNFYQFDGGRPIPIGNNLKQTVFQEINYTYYYLAKALHDSLNKRIYFYYPVGSTGNVDSCVVYNYFTNRWGRDNREIEAVVHYIASGITYDELGDSYATYDDLADVSYEIGFAVAGSPIPAVFDTSHKVMTVTGPAGESSITTGDYGDDQAFTTLMRVRPAFLANPTTATFTHYYRKTLGDSLTTGQTANLNGGKFDVRRSSRWHRGVLTMMGNHEIYGLSADMIPDGEE